MEYLVLIQSIKRVNFLVKSVDFLFKTSDKVLIQWIRMLRLQIFITESLVI